MLLLLLFADDDVLDTVEVETADPEHKVEIHVGLLCTLDAGKVVDGAHTVLNAEELRLVHQVGLVEDETVGERNLFEGLVHYAFGLLLVEVHHGMLCVHEGDDAVKAQRVQQVGLQIKGLNDGSRIRQTRGLDQNVIELALLLSHESTEHINQVAANGAAEATVVEEHDVLLSILLERDKFAVDVNLAKLVFDDDDALAMITRKNTVQERRLAGSADRGKVDLGQLPRRVVVLVSPRVFLVRGLEHAEKMTL